VYGWQVSCPDFSGHLAYLFAHELHHFRRHHLGMHPGEGEQSACRWALARMIEADFDVTGERVQTGRRKVKPLKLSGRRRPKLLKKIKKNARRLNEEDLKALQRWTRKRLKRARAGGALSPAEAHFEALRALPDGTELVITGDDRRSGYLGQQAVKVRTMRRNSTRMVIRTRDGQEWRWPMQWLKPAD
jgi:hypothetical protein